MSSNKRKEQIGWSSEVKQLFCQEFMSETLFWLELWVETFLNGKETLSLDREKHMKDHVMLFMQEKLNQDLFQEEEMD